LDYHPDDEMCGEWKIMPESCKKFMVEGIVQGVGFRPFIYRIAKKNELCGYVKNTGGRVEILVEGSKEHISGFLHDLQFEKPAQSQIDRLDQDNIFSGNYTDFSIIKSNVAITPNSTLVPDIGICKSCIDELTNSDNRRFGYPFISCTECGPRYTLVHALPYDRQNTSMKMFRRCPACDEEYTDPSDRRFHTQAICCQECGPELIFTDNSGRVISRKNGAITDCAKAIDAGKIIAVKGYGGFHLLCDAFEGNVVELLRTRLDRPQQPFAIMSRDIAALKEFVSINPEEEELLKSSRRPIVILNKKKQHEVPEELAPGLHNIGAMLPYSGIHHLLFQHSSSPILVMTSANMPGLPMVTYNEIALQKHSSIADHFLLYNLKTENRLDDSLIRFIANKPVFIRRSRAYVPESIKLPFELKNSVGVGAELNNTITFVSGNKAYLSPYIGNTSHFETAESHADVFSSFSDIISIEPENWGCDLHPQFNTTKFAMEQSANTNIPVQHHHAHTVALMADAGLERDARIIGIALDGTGYGPDGTVWGGEIIESGYTDYDRCAHLKAQPMPGGDICSYYPERMILALLKGTIDDNELLKLPLELKHGLKEARTVLSQLNKNINVMMSSSAGRVLDSASALLGICKYRSYQGEPAMKLESAARVGKETKLELPFVIKNNVLDTSMLLHEIYVLLEKYPISQLAYAFEDAFAKGISQLAIDSAGKTGIDIIGLTGGVAYNEHINSRIQDEVQKAGFEFISHKKVPCGDGGISLGQAIVAGLKGSD